MEKEIIKMDFLADLSDMDLTSILTIDQKELDDLNSQISDSEVETILAEFGFTPFNDFTDIEYDYVSKQQIFTEEIKGQ